jgi:glycosyltransferase involved in cell wall biosynthesis
VITYNEEENIAGCLESLHFCADVVVVDSFSTDRTLAISRQYTPRIYENRYDGNISQKNFALGKVKYDWVLSLDADERVSPELREEIAREFARGFEGCSGYLIRRHVYYLGKWINHCGWYPDYKLRLFDRRHGYFGGSEPHDTFITEGKLKRLKGEIHHFPCDSLSEHLRTIDKYSSITAAELSGCSLGKAVALMIVAPFVKFVEMYIVKRGLLDGVRGLLICCISSFSRFLRYAKAVELNLSRERAKR